MASLRRAAFKSIDPSRAALPTREQEIRQVTNQAKRAGLLAVHKAATRYPQLTTCLLRMGERSGITKIGSGYISDVYKVDDQTVLKVDKDSLGFSARERRRLADRMKDEHQALVDYVGPAVVPHTVDIGPHPEHRFLNAVRITQPYIDVNFLRLNEEEADIPLLAERLRLARSSSPNLFDELGVMISGSRALFAERTLSTDILGVDNVGVAAGGNLALIDAQPVNSQHPGAQTAIEGYFDNLESALALNV